MSSMNEPYAAVPMAEPVAEFDSGSAQTQNLGISILKRWPWLLVGVAGGIVLSLLYHTQRAPVYQSKANLLVIKNRPEMISGGAGNQAVAMVEDYITPQVLLLTSEKVLGPAARSISDSQFQIKPPATEYERLRFLMSGRFTVMREREAGSNTFTNVLGLTFRANNPGDSAQYLRVIIDAYRDGLKTIFEDASTTGAKGLEDQINAKNNEINRIRTGPEGIFALQREIDSTTHEDLTSMKLRLSGYITDKEAMLKRLGTVERNITLIQTIGSKPSNRAVLYIRLVGQPPQPKIGTLDSRNPEDVLFTYRLQRAELSDKWGKDHPEIQSIDSKIRMLKEIVDKTSPADKVQLDELDVYKLQIEQERDSLKEQIESVTSKEKDVQTKIERVSEFVAKKEAQQTRERELTKQVEDLTTQRSQMLITSSSGGFKVEDITKPTDGTQVSPILTYSILYGLLMGLAVGCGLALSMELTDRSFRSPAEIRRRLGLPILGHIPRLRTDEPVERPSAVDIEKSLVSFYRPSSVEAEAYRGVRTQLYFSTQGRGHQVIQVTSPNPGDGKSTLAANLAISIAQSGKRVVLMDCDFRKPRVHKIFRLNKPEAGLASVMSGDTDLASAIQSCEIENLSLMPCGPRPANPAELLTSPKFSDVLKRLRERFEFVIVDTPPILAVSDPSAVAPRVDGVMLVFRMTKNARPLTERAREQLSAVGARMLGVVVNASTARSAGYGGYGSGYSYQYEYQYAENYADQEQ